MSDIEFKNGFLCGLLGTGLGIGGEGDKSGTVNLPPIDQLVVVNLTGYNEVRTYLSKTEYKTVISSSMYNIPKQGYLMIGGWFLIDGKADDWWVVPEADIKFTIDGKVIFEGETADFFGESIMDPPMTYQYKSSFELLAKRRNQTDGMMLALTDTMIVGVR